MCSSGTVFFGTRLKSLTLKFYDRHQKRVDRYGVISRLNENRSVHRFIVFFPRKLRFRNNSPGVSRNAEDANPANTPGPFPALSGDRVALLLLFISKWCIFFSFSFFFFFVIRVLSCVCLF